MSKTKQKHLTFEQAAAILELPPGDIYPVNMTIMLAEAALAVNGAAIKRRLKKKKAKL